MKAKVYLMRHRGRALPQRDVKNSKPLVGDLMLGTVNSKVWGQVQRLELLSAQSTHESNYHVATLYCPVLQMLGFDAMVFRGYESVKDGDDVMGYAQFWRCELNTYFDSPDARIKGALPDTSGRQYNELGEGISK